MYLKKTIKTTVILMTYLICVSSFAQTIQIGQVRELNSNRKPIAGVFIEFEGAIPTTSDDNGYFRISFADKKPGDLMFLNDIRKKGYELVNRRDFEVLKVSSNDTLLQDIILAKSGYVDDAKREYYNISNKALSEAFEKKKLALNKKLKDAERLEREYSYEMKKLKRNKGFFGIRENNDERKRRDLELKIRRVKYDELKYQRQLNELQIQLISQKLNINDLADNFAKVNLDDADSTYIKAIHLYQSGNIEGAIERLEVSYYKESKKQQVNETLLAAKIKMLLLKFQEADQLYIEALKQDSLNLKILDGYSDFLTNQKQVPQAITYSQKIFDQTGNLKDRFFFRNLNRLGILHTEIGKYSLAENHLLSALTEFSTYEKDTINIATEFIDIKLTILNNLGNLNYEKGEYEKAVNYYSKALEIGIYLQENDTNNVDYKLLLANTYGGLGSIFLDFADKKEEAVKYASKYLERSIQIYYELTSKQFIEEDAMYMSAVSYSNLGLLFEKIGEFEKASKYFLQSLDILKKLVTVNPYKFNIEVSRTYLTIGLLNYSQFEQNSQKTDAKIKAKEYFSLARESISEMDYNIELTELLTSTIESYLEKLEEDTDRN